jgi:hypothetical protein
LEQELGIDGANCAAAVRVQVKLTTSVRATLKVGRYGVASIDREVLAGCSEVVMNVKRVAGRVPAIAVGITVDELSALFLLSAMPGSCTLGGQTMRCRVLRVLQRSFDLHVGPP